MKNLMFGASGAALLLSCGHAATEGVELTRLFDELNQRTATHPEVSSTASRLGRRVDTSDGLDLGEAETVALALAPSARAARLAALGAAAVASEAGRWPSPTLSLEALGDVTGGRTPPMQVGIGVEFPIPLSDRLDAAVAEANAEHTLLVLAAVAEERRVVVALRRAWIAWTAASQRARAIEEHVARVGPFITAAETLVAAGETDPDAIELWRLVTQRHALTKRAALSDADAARRAVLVLVGLSATSDLRLVESLEIAPTEGSRSNATEISRHPEVTLALATVERAAAALRRAEAEGAGDLQLGPRATYEDGRTSIGATLSTPLGATEGARVRVAEAKAAHDRAVEDVRSVVFAISARMAQADAQRQAARARLQDVESDWAPLVAAQLERMQRRVATGEFSLVALRETLELRLELEQERLEARADAADAQAELTPVTARSTEAPR